MSSDGRSNVSDGGEKVFGLCLALKEESSGTSREQVTSPEMEGDTWVFVHGWEARRGVWRCVVRVAWVGRL